MLKTPILVGQLPIHNRLVLPPMASAHCPDGKVTDALVDYYEDICRGGHIGLVITEHAYIHPQGRASATQMSVASDDCIPGLTRLVDTIHRCGSKVICQINHAGSATNPNITGGLEAVAPSAVGHPTRGGEAPREMTTEEVAQLPELFAAAARRAKAAGYDGVEIHSAHSYLLNQFYSPLTNKRTDAYGGSLEQRIRVHLEVIAAVRAAVGEEYPIALRLGGCDYMEGGNTVADAAAACKAFAEAGVNLLDISGGMSGFSLGERGPGWFEDQSRAVKAVTDVPVILTGGVGTKAQADALLQDGAADMIGVGRAILQDHRWAEKEMTA